MGKNLFLANLADNYDFSKTKNFMIDEIIQLFNHCASAGRRITEVLFVQKAFDGHDLNAYLENVRDLFGEVNVKLITDGDDPVQMINSAQAIAIGGGNMNMLENYLNPSMCTAVNKRISARIPYIGWNEGSIFACPTRIENLSVLSDNLFAAVPFQFVAHYNNTSANRDIIEDFLQHNQQTIKHVICFKDLTPAVVSGRSATSVGGAVGDSSSPSTATGDEGSGVRIVDDNAGLAGTQAPAAVVLYKLDDDGNLLFVPDPDISVIM